MRTVKLLKEEVNITFNMAVEIAYEDISGAPFDPEALAMQRNCVALYMASIIVNNPDTNITIEALMKDAKLHEIVALRTAVMEAMNEWGAVPAVMEAKEDTKKTKKK